MVYSLVIDFRTRISLGTDFSLFYILQTVSVTIVRHKTSSDTKHNFSLIVQRCHYKLYDARLNLITCIMSALEEDNLETLECARYGEFDELRELLSAGCSSNFQDSLLNTAMHKAGL